MDYDLRKRHSEHTRGMWEDGGLESEFTGPPVEVVEIDFDAETVSITKISPPYQSDEQNTSLDYNS